MRRGTILLLLGATAIIAAACNVENLDYSTAISPTPSGSGSPTPNPVGTYGDGHDGTVTIPAPTVVNVCHSIVLGTNSTLKLDSTTGMAAGDALLVVIMQDDLGGNFVASAGNGGRWEIAKVSSTLNATDITLGGALSRRYDSFAQVGQACRIPEYQDLTVTAAGKIIAAAWDGSTGGVAAVMVAGTLTLAGSFDVSGAGFRGGATPAVSTMQHSTSFTASTTSGHGGKGESVDSSGGSGGRSANTNGGGGGDPWVAGGGGGGNGGVGGAGGIEHESAVPAPITNGGIGGQSLSSISTPERIWMGGGGGAGAIGVSASSAGGSGGGAIWIRANVITGAGSLAADGTAGTVATVDKVGGGGGGGGGSILFYAGTQTGFTGPVSAKGGAGGNVTVDGAGPGGGGSGGRLWAPVKPSGASALTGGSAGTAGGLGARGATAGTTGVTLP